MAEGAQVGAALVVISDAMHTDCCWNACSFDPLFELFTVCPAS